jgi:type I restriction enzyme S subunit
MANQQVFKETKIGRIPKEWKAVELSQIGNIVTGTTPSTKVEEYWGKGFPFVTPTDFSEKKYVDQTERMVTNQGAETARLIPKDSVMVVCIASVGEVAMASAECITNQQINTIACNQGTYCHFVYYAMVFSKTRLKRWAGITTSPIIKKSLFKKFPLPLPPLPEQKKIADILSTVDQAIEKVDEAIDKTQRLKRGLMQELLTKGIGHKEFKDTDIGRMPKEWKVMKLGETSNVRYGLGQPPALETNGIPMIRATNIKRGKIVKEGLIFLSPNAVPKSRDPFLRVGDILVVRSGAYTGDVALVTKEWDGAVAGYDLIVTPLDTIDSQFLAYYLLSSSVQKRHFFGLKVRSAQPHLNSSQVKETPIPIPPLPEQRNIAGVLGTVDERLELLRKRKERLKRTKKGLMNDLLTGKRRVQLEA